MNNNDLSCLHVKGGLARIFVLSILPQRTIDTLTERSRIELSNSGFDITKKQGVRFLPVSCGISPSQTPFLRVLLFDIKLT